MAIYKDTIWQLNTLRPRQNGCHFPDDIFKWIFLNENVWISINISLKFGPRGPINNIQTLVQVMAWHRLGNKPLSEPMMVRLLTHICVTRPQWVNAKETKLQCISNEVMSLLFWAIDMRNAASYSTIKSKAQFITYFSWTLFEQINTFEHVL